MLRRILKSLVGQIGIICLWEPIPSLKSGFLCFLDDMLRFKMQVIFGAAYLIYILRDCLFVLDTNGKGACDDFMLLILFKELMAIWQSKVSVINGVDYRWDLGTALIRCFKFNEFSVLYLLCIWAHTTISKVDHFPRSICCVESTSSPSLQSFGNCRTNRCSISMFERRYIKNQKYQQQ